MAIRGAAGATGDLPRTIAVDGDVENPRRTLDDRLQLLGVVVVEPGHEAEPIAQRPGDHAGSGGGAHERERRHREPDAGRRRALADDDVELEVLHRRIQDLLDRPRQSVDLVDEQHVAVFELGEDRREIARSFERGPRGHVQVYPHLGCDDARERRLSESWRPCEQQMVDGLLASAGRLEHDAQVLLQLSLSDEFVEGTWSQPGFELDLRGDHVVVTRTDPRIEELVTHGAPPAS